MDSEDYGDSLKPNIPAVFAIQSGNLVLLTYGGSYIALESRPPSADNLRVLYSGNTLNNSRISFAIIVEDELILGTVSRLLERRCLKTGTLRGKYLTSTRLSGLAGYNKDHLITGDKFGDLILQSWSELEAQSIRAVKDGLAHLKQHQKDVHYAETHTSLLNLWPELAESASTDQPSIPPNITTPPTEAATDGTDCEEGDISATQEQQSNSSESPTRNKFDSGKDLALMLREFEESMGPSFMGHMATITTLALHDVGGKTVCITSDKDEKIRVTNIPEMWNVEAILTGHTEFITDVIPTGNPEQIISCSGDRTCRLWNISTQTQVGQSLSLPSMPIRMLRVEDGAADSSGRCFTVLCAQTKTIFDLIIKDDTLELVGQRELPIPELPLTMSTDRRYCVDLKGSVRDCNTGCEIARFPDTAQPLFIRYWKHDRQLDAMSADERRAKRLRHDDGTPH